MDIYIYIYIYISLKRVTYTDSLYMSCKKCMLLLHILAYFAFIPTPKSGIYLIFSFFGLGIGGEKTEKDGTEKNRARLLYSRVCK